MGGSIRLRLLNVISKLLVVPILPDRRDSAQRNSGLVDSYPSCCQAPPAAPIHQWDRSSGSERDATRSHLVDVASLGRRGTWNRTGGEVETRQASGTSRGPLRFQMVVDLFWILAK
jgi:hypothetical protein